MDPRLTALDTGGASARDPSASESSGLYLVLLSIHGLIRGRDLELGRDADTGGQTLYVVEQARALAARPDVAGVDLLTRRVVDASVSADYAQPLEHLTNKARIVRLDAGPGSYLPKEALWDHLDIFADNVLSFLRAEGRLPAAVHSHYADAGYVGWRVAAQLGVPLLHTGHSLGRVKRTRLLASGIAREVIEERYRMTTRVRAEEETLAAADLVIASTADEVDKQYALYDHYRPDHMRVIPPGVDLVRFHAPDGTEAQAPIGRELARFLTDPSKPLILAVSRPDERKNIATLVRAYGESAALQERANLAIVAGCRDDIRDLDSGAQTVLTTLLLDIDRYDLHGKVAYPKQHRRDEVPVLFRLAAASGGVFVNPALTEPFGLTLIEAAASGLPVVATSDGGPRDILANCGHGLLVDPLSSDDMAGALLSMLADPGLRREMARRGIEGARRNYSWSAHAAAYLEQLRPLLQRSRAAAVASPQFGVDTYQDRCLVTSLDQNLVGDPAALADLANVVRAHKKRALFGIATGRSLKSALRVIRQHAIPLPGVLISSLGTAIHYGPAFEPDEAWERHIDHLWTPRHVRSVLDDLPGLALQPRIEQARFKVSYYIDPQHAPALDEITSLLHQADQTVNVTLSFGQFLDVIPVRASKGMALRWFTGRWGIDLERVLAAGGSGADEDMMRGNTLAVVVANRHHEELSGLTDAGRIYFAKSAYAHGILEAIEYYDFYGECCLPRAAEA